MTMDREPIPPERAGECAARIVDAQAVAGAIASLPDADAQARLVDVFRAVADATRLRLLLALEDRELCVCDLCAALDQSQPKISRHLAMLRESGLLQDRKQGKWVHYRLSPHIPSWAAQVIEQAWLSQQDDVQAIARKLATANCSGSGKAICL